MLREMAMPAGKNNKATEPHQRILRSIRGNKMAGNKLDKCPRNSKIVVMTTWLGTKEIPPTFGRLMALLLKQKTGHRENDSDHN